MGGDLVAGSVARFEFEKGLERGDRGDDIADRACMRPASPPKGQGLGREKQHALHGFGGLGTWFICIRRSLTLFCSRNRISRSLTAL